jgi:putative addiction module component (TIGR02574 family)
MQSPSVFDLSKSEKLQLVEDLWDDLAASSEDVPVQEWQKLELDRRKSNLQRTSLSSLSWEELKGNIRKGYVR